MSGRVCDFSWSCVRSIWWTGICGIRWTRIGNFCHSWRGICGIGWSWICYLCNRWVSILWAISWTCWVTISWCRNNFCGWSVRSYFSDWCGIWNRWRSIWRWRKIFIRNCVLSDSWCNVSWTSGLVSWTSGLIGISGRRCEFSDGWSNIGFRYSWSWNVFGYTSCLCVMR